MTTSPGRRISRRFTDHPASVDETYLEHFRVAMGFARTLAAAAGAAVVHAVVPSCCERSASRRIVELNERISSGHRAAVTETLRDELRAVG